MKPKGRKWGIFDKSPEVLPPTRWVVEKRWALFNLRDGFLTVDNTGSTKRQMLDDCPPHCRVVRIEVRGEVPRLKEAP